MAVAEPNMATSVVMRRLYALRGFWGSAIMQAQPPRVQHKIPSLCWTLGGCACVLGEIRGAPKFLKKVAAAARTFCRTQAAAKICRPARHFARLTALAQRLIQPHLCRRRRTGAGPWANWPSARSAAATRGCAWTRSERSAGWAAARAAVFDDALHWPRLVTVHVVIV